MVVWARWRMVVTGLRPCLPVLFSPSQWGVLVCGRAPRMLEGGAAATASRALLLLSSAKDVWSPSRCSYFGNHMLAGVDPCFRFGTSLLWERNGR